MPLAVLMFLAYDSAKGIARFSVGIKGKAVEKWPAWLDRYVRIQSFNSSAFISLIYYSELLNLELDFHYLNWLL